MKKTFRAPLFSTLFLFLAVPFFALAQSGGINTAVLKPYASSIQSIINDIFVPVLLAIAFIVFLWGVYKYFILGAADATSRADGRQFVLWGVIGFTVIFSLWGFVWLLQGALNFTNTKSPNPPTFGSSAATNPSGAPYTPSSGTSGKIQCVNPSDCPTGQACTLGVCGSGTGAYSNSN